MPILYEEQKRENISARENYEKEIFDGIFIGSNVSTFSLFYDRL